MEKIGTFLLIVGLLLFGGFTLYVIGKILYDVLDTIPIWALFAFSGLGLIAAGAIILGPKDD